MNYSDTLINLSFLVITAFCWGITNVLIKKGSIGINKVKADNKLTQILVEIKFLFLNWKVVIKIFVYKFVNLCFFIYSLVSASFYSESMRISSLCVCTSTQQTFDCCSCNKFFNSPDYFSYIDYYREREN